jgi:predicted transcriptional regulator
MSGGHVRIHGGEAMEHLGARFVDAWLRMERGDIVDEKHISFETWETMVRVLSPKRLALLRHVHRQPAKSVRALTVALGRDYRRVHEDVAALEGAGLRDRDSEDVRADYDVFDVKMRLAL